MRVDELACLITNYHTPIERISFGTTFWDRLCENSMKYYSRNIRNEEAAGSALFLGVKIELDPSLDAIGANLKIWTNKNA